MKVDTFHERPLVAFTTLAILGAGQLTGPLVSLAAGHPWSSSRLVGLAGVALLAAGLGASLLHLGRPWLSPLALRRAGRSRLSTEVALAAILLAAAALAVLVDGAVIIASATAILALAFLLALGQVYNLRGQRTWRGPWMATPCLLGLTAGALGVAASSGASDRIMAAARLLIVGDAAVFLGHWILVGKPGGLPHISLLGARVVLANVLAGGLVAARRPGFALALLALGVLADRLAFYLLAMPHTTEAEIARVEALIE